MNIKAEFEKWRKDKFPALNGISTTTLNGWILIYGERSYTAGAKMARKKTLEEIKDKLYINAPENGNNHYSNSAIIGGTDKFIDTELKNLNDPMPPH